MSAAQFVREARKRAGLTQRELAERAGTSQSAIARYESGESDPSLKTLTRILRTCGFGLAVRLIPYDDHDFGLAVLNRTLTPEQRLRQFEDLLDFVDEARRAKRVG